MPLNLSMSITGAKKKLNAKDFAELARKGEFREIYEQAIANGLELQPAGIRFRELREAVLNSNKSTDEILLDLYDMIIRYDAG